ncbi:CYTH domain-containing protein [Candidatus Borrarchaeum sp.]|uniref:CYTH domain-containing protein n=1 Tax=Candidatus Borrarchaeum sp. TaxID=2846742 RepID=UPI00257F5FDE|nr:CYTH domain-containing protein [Candidatus Borrarchaeum sp.]
MTFKEFEIKLAANGKIKEIKGQLHKFGFEQTKDVIQFDYYYDVVGQRKLYTNDERLRIRLEYTPLQELSYCQWTWKGSRPTRETDLREDHSIDIPVDQAEDLRTILEKLGYEVLVAFRKVRTRYRIAESEIEIEFDEKVTLLHEDKEIPMGSFLQVSLESELPEDISVIELEKDLMNYAKRLGFSEKDRIDTTYVEIALKKLKKEN